MYLMTSEGWKLVLFILLEAGRFPRVFTVPASLLSIAQRQAGVNCMVETEKTRTKPWERESVFETSLCVLVGVLFPLTEVWT